jgi:hypothetical protein
VTTKRRSKHPAIQYKSMFFDKKCFVWMFFDSKAMLLTVLQ